MRFKVDIIFPGVLFLLLTVAMSIVPAASAQTDHGFTFVRVKYSDNPGEWVRQFGRETWSHDYPTAEYNFYEALERTTKIHVGRPPVVLELSDERIFEYPVLYLCEPGYWIMDEEEVTNLREYLQRGGFILFDDFRGEPEWMNLVIQLERLFPDREPVELPNDHFIWSIYYDVDPVATPSLTSGGGRGRRGFGRGGGDSGGVAGNASPDRYYGLFDDNGRLMAMIAYNQDLGDGWEWPDNNFENASLMTFQMGVNFLMYAFTH
jgi:hypothetical protein